MSPPKERVPLYITARYGSSETSHNTVDSPEIRALEETGFSRLVPLMEPTNEASFLTLLQEWALHPIGHLPQEAECYAPLIVQLIPEKDLFGIYGTSWDQKEVKLTFVGRLLIGLLEKYPGLFLFLIDGSASEAIHGLKPAPNRRKAGYYLNYDPQYTGPIRPSADVDVLGVVSSRQLTEKAISQTLDETRTGRKTSAVVSIKQPKAHPATLVRISTPGRWKHREGLPHNTLLRGGSFLDFSFAERQGRYSSRFGLIDFLMSRGGLPPPILLVPVKSGDRITGLKGLAIDLVYHRRERIVAYYQETTPKPLLPVVYPWPDYAFPRQSPQEAFYHFCHEFRTWPWMQSTPIVEINPCGSVVYSWREAMVYQDKRALRELSQRTAGFFAEQIVYPLAANPNLLGLDTARRAATKTCLETLQKSLDGDPCISFIRCLSAGRTIKGFPAYGMGLFDPERGFFPSLGNFLETEGRENRLSQKLSKCQKTGEGWRVFLEFLFKETGFNTTAVARLLNPVFSSYQPRYFVRALSRLDPVFQQLSEHKTRG